MLLSTLIVLGYWLLGSCSAGHLGRPSQLPSCQRLLANMSYLQMDLLHSLIPHFYFNTTNASSTNISPTPTPAVTAAAADAALAGALQLLQDSSALPRGDATIDSRIKACALFNVQRSSNSPRPVPRVSFLLQYFRGHDNKIPRFLEHIASCNKFVHTELLVNVDSPQDLARWQNASLFSKGEIVAVLSNNVHEIR